MGSPMDKGDLDEAMQDMDKDNSGKLPNKQVLGCSRSHSSSPNDASKEK